ncbi:MAG TPA: citrate synthase [Eubacteriales bacterium]|jgi:citrate synthase|nr:citrate synthase [Eubacteriales bacterium]HRU84734.1 citrate synthase [Eubacteriales bacterium]
MNNLNDFENLSKAKIGEIVELVKRCDYISSDLYEKHKVFRGLRDPEGNGVVTGLTEISEVNAFRNENGQRIPIEGECFYRGIPIQDLIHGAQEEKRFGFEETAYLLLCGKLPNQRELEDFIFLLNGYRGLPDNFLRDVILKAPSSNIMNAMSKAILTLYSYDDQPENLDVKNVFVQCLKLIANFPLLAVYSYQAHKYYNLGRNLSIRNPNPEMSTAENILYMLRGSDKYTKREAKLLDACLILHAEHGGGNNSTFTTRVVSSSGTDTYSAIAAAMGSLKGPKHGGANIKVVEMIENILENLTSFDDDSIKEYLGKILDGEVFDGQGLIYGLGHAIYSLSDPRANLLSELLHEYKFDNNLEYEIYQKVFRLAPAVISAKRRIYKGVAVNIDFYTGYIYKMLKIPLEMFTPIFAISRIAGWSAHRIEELVNQSKIIRPAYVAVGPRQQYIPLKDRE